MKRQSAVKDFGRGLLFWVVIWAVILIGSAIQYG